MADFFKKKSKGQAEAVPPLKQAQVRVAKSAYRKVVIKQFASVISLSLIGLFLLYGAFAATLLRVVPTTTAGFVPVKNVTYPGGNIPAEKEVLISVGNAQGKTIGDRLKQSFILTDDAAIVKVIAGPNGTLDWVEPDILTVNGVPTGVHLKPEEGKRSPLVTRDSKFLKSEYLAVCVKGDCVVGDGLIFNKDKIIGVPLNQSSVDKAISKD